MTGKRKSIIALILFELFFTVLLFIIYMDIFRDQKALRLDKLYSDSYILGEWIRDSYTASGYLLKSIIRIVPTEEVYYPPRDTQIYSDGRERVDLLRSSFPYARVAGIIDDNGILTHSFYHDGLDMKEFDFYEELLNSPSGAFFMTDAFQMDDGAWVVCHALKYEDSQRNIMAVMMLDLEFFESWLARQEYENSETVIVVDRSGHPLAGGCIDSCDHVGEGIHHIEQSWLKDTEGFHLYKDEDGISYALRRIPALPYTIIFVNPLIVSLSELILPFIIIMIGYVSIVILGIMVFRSHISQINLNLELEERSTEMTAIFENSMVGIIMLDDKYRINRANHRFAEIFGYDSVDEVLGMHISEFHISEERFRHFVHLYRNAIRKEGVIKIDYEAQQKEGSRLWARVVGKPLSLRGHADYSRRQIWIVEDISEQRYAEERLKELASTDPMTGIANRRRFMDFGERESAISLRHKRPLSVVMLDIDHFKVVNDTYGHAVGDKAIILAVEVCSKKPAGRGPFRQDRRGGVRLNPPGHEPGRRIPCGRAHTGDDRSRDKRQR